MFISTDWIFQASLFGGYFHVTSAKLIIAFQNCLYMFLSLSIFDSDFLEFYSKIYGFNCLYFFFCFLLFSFPGRC
jgi:hypothetical protein